MGFDMTLRVLLRQIAEDGWHAISLEHCILAQAETEDAVREEFGALLAAEIAFGIRHRNSRKPLAGIPPAPLDVQVDFARAEPCQEAPAKMTLLLEAEGRTREVELPDRQERRAA